MNIEFHEPRPPGGLVVTNLRKLYGSKLVVDDVSFHCPPGSITGFIGPNGSGKSTTLRMIVGHASPSSGTALFDGVAFHSLVEPAEVVGVLLDASALHPGRSVQETALLAALMMGAPSTRSRECVAAVGLESVRRRRVGSLSLGMRQRLGLALAIIGAPRYLILDEPANGLDPEGILWLRDFLRSFAGSGGTVLVSSHQLAEVEAVADRVVIIDRGRASTRPVGAPATPETVRTLVSAADDDHLRRVLESHGVTVETTPDGSPLVAFASARRVGALALEARVPLHLLMAEPSSLDETFRRTTSGEFRGLSGSELGVLVSKGISR